MSQLDERDLFELIENDRMGFGVFRACVLMETSNTQVNYRNQ